MTTTASCPPSPTAPAEPTWFRRHTPLLLLFLLTLLGGALRFSWLDRPPLWGDESMTYSRVSGTYQDMLDRLKDDGFPPLHYSAYWWLGQHVPLTPFWMRFIPALAGTLMIPAMYALSRQFTGRRTALLVAAYTAASAYLLVYSRDAKMYMHLWLFVVLHLTCLIAWLRTRGRLLWWGWVTAGIAMVGTSMTGIAVIAIGPLLLLTAREVRWWRTVFYVLGLGFILAGPIFYYTQFNQWVQHVEENSRRTGIVWVERYNAQRDGPGLVLFTASAYLLSWEWPTAEDLPTIPPRIATTLKLIVTLLFAIAALGIFPWPRRWLPAQRRALETPPRSLLWLALMLVIPAYGFYCASIPEPAAPHDWLLWVAQRPWVLLGAAMLLAAWVSKAIAHPDTGPRYLFQVPMVVAALLATLYAVRSVVPTWDYSVWMPRYLGFAWPAFGIVLCVLVLRLPTRWGRAAAILLLLGANLAQFSARIFTPTETRVDLIAQDILDGLNEPGNPTRTYNAIPDRGMGAPGTATPASIATRYYLDLLTHTRHTPTELRQGFYRYYKVRRFGDPREIERDLAHSKQLQRIIVWNQTRPSQPMLDRDLFAAHPPDGWRLAAFNVFPAVDHWKWQHLSTWYRWEYVRDDPATH